MGPNVWRRWHCALHEFAHHVTYFVARDAPSHGRVFREALEMVASMALGDAARYAWVSEYRSIAMHGRRRGLVR